MTEDEPEGGAGKPFMTIVMLILAVVLLAIVFFLVFKVKGALT